MEQRKLEWFYNKIVGLQTDMYRFAYSVLKSSDLCEDAVHNAILKAHDNLHQLKNEEAFRAWMFRIIRNECLAVVKKQKRFVLLDAEMALQETGAVEDRIDVGNAVLQLSRKYREVIVLYYYYEYSLAEIAEILRISQGTVKSRLARARKALHRMLEGSGKEDSHEGLEEYRDKEAD